MNKIYILCITWIDDYIYIHILYEYRKEAIRIKKKETSMKEKNF